jgi:hypothetical protein
LIRVTSDSVVPTAKSQAQHALKQSVTTQDESDTAIEVRKRHIDGRGQRGAGCEEKIYQRRALTTRMQPVKSVPLPAADSAGQARGVDVPIRTTAA